MRVAMWRRLRKLGAVYMNEGIWVMPNVPEMKLGVDAAMREIQNFDGSASAFVSRDLDVAQQARLRARILAARDEEYAELDGQIERFFTHVQHATETRRYTFAEVEELEEEVAKLEVWLKEIQGRDFFRSPQYDVNLEALRRAKGELQAFTERAYAESPEDVAREMGPSE